MQLRDTSADQSVAPTMMGEVAPWRIFAAEERLVVHDKICDQRWSVSQTHLAMTGAPDGSKHSNEGEQFGTNGPRRLRLTHESAARL